MEKFLGWPKLDSVLRQGKVRGLKRVDWFNRLTMAAYNLMRMRRLIPIEALSSSRIFTFAIVFRALSS